MLALLLLLQYLLKLVVKLYQSALDIIIDISHILGILKPLNS